MCVWVSALPQVLGAHVALDADAGAQDLATAGPQALEHQLGRVLGTNTVSLSPLPGVTRARCHPCPVLPIPAVTWCHPGHCHYCSVSPVRCVTRAQHHPCPVSLVPAVTRAQCHPRLVSLVPAVTRAQCHSFPVSPLPGATQDTVPVSVPVTVTHLPPARRRLPRRRGLGVGIEAVVGQRGRGGTARAVRRGRGDTAGTVRGGRGGTATTVRG